MGKGEVVEGEGSGSGGQPGKRETQRDPDQQAETNGEQSNIQSERDKKRKTRSMYVCTHTQAHKGSSTPAEQPPAPLTPAFSGQGKPLTGHLWQGRLPQPLLPANPEANGTHTQSLWQQVTGLPSITR